jgi:hypothetical protein
VATRSGTCLLLAAQLQGSLLRRRAGPLCSTVVRLMPLAGSLPHSCVGARYSHVNACYSCMSMPFVGSLPHSCVGACYSCMSMLQLHERMPQLLAHAPGM